MNPPVAHAARAVQVNDVAVAVQEFGEGEPLPIVKRHLSVAWLLDRDRPGLSWAGRLPRHHLRPAGHGRLRAWLRCSQRGLPRLGRPRAARDSRRRPRPRPWLLVGERNRPGARACRPGPGGLARPVLHMGSHRWLPARDDDGATPSPGHATTCSPSLTARSPHSGPPTTNSWPSWRRSPTSNWLARQAPRSGPWHKCFHIWAAAPRSPSPPTAPPWTASPPLGRSSTSPCGSAGTP